MVSAVMIIFIVLIIAAAFFLFRVEHYGKKIKLFLLILLVFILYISVVSLSKSESVDLTSPKGIIKAVYMYVGWIGNVFSGLFDAGKDATHAVGNVVKTNITDRAK